VDAQLPLSDIRVVDTSTGIAGAYCTKLLADAGAQVVKVEGDLGDPLRRRATGKELPAGETGALFQYLHAGKRSLVGQVGDAALRSVLAGADLVVEDGLDGESMLRLQSEFPDLLVVSLSWFGRSGPWSERPANEFTVQAACGSLKSRGTPDRAPLAAGGQLGEWIAGGYAGTIALAALRAPTWSRHLDISIFECMCLTMGGHLDLAAQMGQPRLPRYVELPSVEETKDGVVGFCTITRQQFSDFLALIGHPELIDDDHLATYAGRQERAAMFHQMVREWSATQTTDDILDMASAMRIPVAPIGRPSTVPSLEHFVARGVFCAQPGTSFMRPRPPYRFNGEWLSEPRPAPALGELGQRAPWGERSVVEPAPPAGLPLQGIRVVDLTAFWAGPSGTHLLAALGAEVIKVESVRRPDGMRFSTTRSPQQSEQWWEWSPIFQWMNVNKRGVTLDITTEAGRAILLKLAQSSDVLIENFSPRVLEQCGLTWESIHEANPQLTMVRMPAFGLTGPWRDRPGFAQTMEQMTGMAWITGYPERPPIVPKGPCDPTAGIHAAFAVLAGLRASAQGGVGVFVEVPMVETALNIAAEAAIEFSAYGVEASRNGNHSARVSPQGTYPCRGDDEWVALSIESDAQWECFAALVGEPHLQTPALLVEAERRRQADGLDYHIAEWTRTRTASAVEEALWLAGIPAARVVSPYDLRENPQLAHRRFFESLQHPVLGDLHLMTLPFPRPDGQGWIRTPAPMLGQDNWAVLSQSGIDQADFEVLRQSDVIGDRIVTSATNAGR
jgi:crotonobetainyl-CoA:carnitine CoA-transferase CaiB-like acyl-CoA transferase